MYLRDGLHMGPFHKSPPPPVLSCHKALGQEYLNASGGRVIHLSTAVYKRKSTKKKISTAAALFSYLTCAMNIQEHDEHEGERRIYILYEYNNL